MLIYKQQPLPHLTIRGGQMEEGIEKFRQSFPEAELQVLGNPTPTAQTTKPPASTRQGPPWHKGRRRSGNRSYAARIGGKLPNRR